MTTFAEFRQAMDAWLTAAGYGTRYIWEHQDPMPVKLTYPFVSLHIVHDQRAHVPETVHDFVAGAETGQEIVTRRRWEHRLCLRVSVHSDVKAGTLGARDITETLIMRLRREAVVAALAALGVAAHDKGKSLSLPTVDAGKHVDRVITDMYFYFVSEDQEAFGYFDTVVMQGTVDDEEGPEIQISVDDA